MFTVVATSPVSWSSTFFEPRPLGMKPRMNSVPLLSSAPEMLAKVIINTRERKKSFIVERWIGSEQQQCKHHARRSQPQQ